jgi:hypothetical protein
LNFCWSLTVFLQSSEAAFDFFNETVLSKEPNLWDIEGFVKSKFDDWRGRGSCFLALLNAVLHLRLIELSEKEHMLFLITCELTRSGQTLGGQSLSIGS